MFISNISGPCFGVEKKQRQISSLNLASICQKILQVFHTILKIIPHSGESRFAVFPSPAGMSLTKLSLAGKNLIIPGRGELGKHVIPAGDGKTASIFLQCILYGSFALFYLNDILSLPLSPLLPAKSDH
jgi:hypothetical protein